MELTVDTSRAVPPSRQLVEGVLDALAGSRLAAGDRLPSVRGLAAEALVNPNTVGKAYRDLESRGVVEGRAGAGVYVTPEGPEIARRERRGATLKRVRGALHAAMAAGHGRDAVLRGGGRTLGKQRAPVNGGVR